MHRRSRGKRGHAITAGVVVGLTVLGAAGGLGVAETQPATYRTTAAVYFAVQAGSSSGALSRAYAYGQTQVQAYARVATSPVVLAPVVARLGLRESPATLAHDVVAHVPVGTQVIEITATGRSAQRVADVANAVAGELSTAVDHLSPTVAGDAAAVVRVRTVAQAQPPHAPATPRPRLALLTGALVGLLAGLALVFLPWREMTRREVSARRGRTPSAAR